MKILHISCITNPLGNGVAEAIKSYLKYEKKFTDIALYNLRKEIRVDDILCFNSDYKTISSLPNGFNKPDLVIFNEVYKKEYIKLYKECLKNNIPYIIIPHGCLVRKAQEKKHLKKLLANLLLFNKFIKKSISLQYLNIEEKNNSVFNKKYIISGNGVNKPKLFNNYTNSDLIYIGRYDINTKGLDLIVNICKKNKDWFITNNVKIKFYGRTSGNDLNVLKETIINNNIDDILICNDSIYGDDKTDILVNAYAFIQTSRHEGLPMGILEALSIGLPCIVTNQTNLGDFITKYKCGYSSDINEDEIFNNIKKIYENKDLRNEFSKNSIKYTNEIYSFENIAKDCIEQYKKLLGE